MKFKKSALALVVASMSSVAAHAGWVSTQTKAQPVFDRAGGAVQAQEELAAGQTLQITVGLQLRNEAELDARVARIMGGSRADVIAPSDFLAHYAPTAAQAQAVVDHLRSAGFWNIVVADNRLLVTAEGTAGAAKLAFHTELHNFSRDGERVFANTGDAQVPDALAGSVRAVLGLNNASAPQLMLKKADPNAAPVRDATSGTKVGHLPTDFPVIYNASSLPAVSTVDVAIVSDGVMTQTLADLQTFLNAHSFPALTTNVVLAGAQGTDTSGTPEWNLDSQDIVAAAGGTLHSLTFYVATSLSDSALTAAYNQAVSAGTAKLINVSLGECETSAQTSGVEATDDAIFKTAVAQGQTFSVSTGDSDSYECGGRKSKQSYPAVSPYVIAVGGTALYTTNTTTYATEQVWFTSSTEGTGGGPSTTETAPSYQTASGVLGTSTARGVADIAFDADPASGSLIYINGTTAGNQYGGTSLASPLFVGFWARILQANPGAASFPASAFYKYFVNASTAAAVLHDVTVGSNGGYSAKVGWDYPTGFGSFNVAPLSSFVAANAGF